MRNKLLLVLSLFYCCSLMAAPVNPTASTSVTVERAKQLYTEHCFVCHYAGGAGSPKLGDEKAWNPRIKEGKESLLKNTWDGLNFMPAKGLCNDCTQEELSAVIDYMLSQCPKCDKLPAKENKSNKSTHPVKK